MNYNFLSQITFFFALLNLLVYWIDLFFLTKPRVAPAASRVSPVRGSNQVFVPVSFSSSLEKNQLAQKKGFFPFLEKITKQKKLGLKMRLDFSSVEVSKWLTSLGLCFSLGFLILFRYLKVNHFPLSNFYEALIFLAWCLAFLNLYNIEEFKKVKGIFNIRIPRPEGSHFNVGLKTFSKQNLVSFFTSYQKIVPFLSFFTNQSRSHLKPVDSQNVEKNKLTIKANKWRDKLDFNLSRIKNTPEFLASNLRVDSIASSLNSLTKNRSNSTLNPSLEFSSSLLTSQNPISTNQKFASPSSKLQEKKIYGAILAPCILFILAFAQFYLSSEFNALVPALKSNWLMMHVSIMIASYTTFISGGLISLVLLIQTFFFTSSQSNLATKETYQYDLLETGAVKNSNVVSLAPQSEKARFFSKKKSLGWSPSGYTEKIIRQLKKKQFYETLDNLNYRLVGLGFPLFTLGLLRGAVWANSAWGSYWSWDIKEVGSFIQWLAIAFYFHCRYKNYQTLTHVISFLTLLILFFNFFGISLGIFGSSLHAYS